jgi:adenylate cyclase
MTLWLLGFPDRALERMEGAVRMARDVSHAESLVWTLLGKCEVGKGRREARQTRVAAKELFSICEVNGLVMQPVMAKEFCGWARAIEGNPELGCSEIRDAFSACSVPGLILSEARGHALLAEAYWYAGDAEKGLFSLEEPLTSTKSEERNFAAELCRLRGDLLLQCARTKGSLRDHGTFCICAWPHLCVGALADPRIRSAQQRRQTQSH